MTRARAVTAALLAVLALALVAVVVLVVSGADDDSSNPASTATTSRLSFFITPVPAVRPFAGLTEAELAVGGKCRRVVIADSLDESVQGLTGRSDLGPYDGMLFVFGERTTTSFTMSGVPVSLDIGFYGVNGTPVSRRHMKPCPEARADCPSYTASGPFSYALETPSGELPAGALSSCS